MTDMDYTDHKFTDIKYKDGPDRDPKVTLKYEAISEETDETVQSKDKFKRTPHHEFRDTWRGIIEYWKMNLEEILGDVNWNIEEVRPVRIKIKYQNDKPVAVQYYCNVTAPFDEQETIPTPYVQPSMAEGEIEMVRSLCREAIEYIRGKQDQTSMEFNEGSPNEGSPNDGSPSEGSPNEEGEPEPKDGGDVDPESHATDLSDVF